MESKILNIKNMVCDRCIKVVREELAKIGYPPEDVRLGEAKIKSSGEIDLDKIRRTLEDNGFELLGNKQAKMIEDIKAALIDLIQNKPEKLEKISISKFLADKFHSSYQHISSLFSSKEGITIEKYFINQKIEKAKELLIYNELNLSEISYMLGYSSVQHLSNQFKKVTGFTPSDFKKLKNKNRKPLDKLS
ncbi:MAG: helix-turn-helix domain-containing protein [Ignavibacteriales bacterium]|nr:MAG: helix-turn-helix domain-containing protein [Ignavibacteriales bacterium]